MKGTQFFEEIAAAPDFASIPPEVGAFFRRYLEGEKVARFGDQWVINTHFPPFPSRAFSNMVSQLRDTSGRPRLYSVTLAVTNRCFLRCWHCYNAGRNTRDVPLDVFRQTAARLQDHGAVVVTLTGGEPLLRPDLEQIAASFDDRTCVIVGTTGWGLDAARARALRQSGVFGVGISLDCADEQEHDRRRGRAGAFRAAADGLAAAGAAGLYPYVVSVAMREFLDPDVFHAFLRRVKELGGLGVHLLEPCPTGRIAGRDDLSLTPAERARIIAFQHEVAAREDLPLLSTYTYLESPENFGCGAGLTHMYIDGSGELCPCNLVPLSFGNITREPLDVLLDRMRRHFRQPRAHCVGKLLSRGLPEGAVPTPPEISAAVCADRLAVDAPLPAFARIRAAAQRGHAPDDLREAYDQISGEYDRAWLSRAGAPVEDLLRRMPWRGGERVFEAGCGSGYATVRLAEHVGPGGSVHAADLSAGMQEVARRRAGAAGCRNIVFRLGDALELLRTETNLDVVFSSWVLGYIPVPEFLATAREALAPGGRVAFVVHRENSPRREFSLFSRIVARDPSVLLRPVGFPFPEGAEHIRRLLASAGLAPVEVWEGACVFSCRTPADVLDHLLQSGAGTVFYDALDPARRPALTESFLRELAPLRDSDAGFEVRHDFVACIAQRITQGRIPDWVARENPLRGAEKCNGWKFADSRLWSICVSWKGQISDFFEDD